MRILRRLVAKPNANFRQMTRVRNRIHSLLDANSSGHSQVSAGPRRYGVSYWA